VVFEVRVKLPVTYKVIATLITAGVFCCFIARIRNSDTVQAVISAALLLSSLVWARLTYRTGVLIVNDYVEIRYYTRTIRIPRRTARFRVSNWKSPIRILFRYSMLPSIFAMLRVDVRDRVYYLPFTMTTQRNATRMATRLNSILNISQQPIDIDGRHRSGAIITNRALRMAEIGYENWTYYPLWAIVSKLTGRKKQIRS